jgi:hypothetical protein
MQTRPRWDPGQFAFTRQIEPALTFSPPASRRRYLQHASFPRGISRKSTTKSHPVRKIQTEWFITKMHTNTIAIFLIKITTNEHLKSYNNPLYYTLKYGITAKFGNFGSKVSAFNWDKRSWKHAAWSKPEVFRTVFWVCIWPLFVISANSREAGSSKNR